jgi:type IV pilus assembly protein PilW
MKRHSQAQRGFTLIEVLVGLGIGLVGIVVMFRMVALWETSSRSATAGSDTQVSGTLGMYALERDLRQAGMGIGLTDAPFLGSQVVADNAGTVVNIPALVPVWIQPGGAAPDRIDILYGDSSFFGGNAPALESGTPGQTQRRDLLFRSSTATSKTLERRGMFRPGDLAVVCGNESALPSSATCHLIEVTSTANPDNLTIDHVAGNYNSFYAAAPVPSQFNPAGGTGGVFVSGRIYNMGPNPRQNVWSLRADGTLTHSDRLRPALAPIDVAERVVNLKAEYGLDTNGDRLPDTWTSVPPADWTTLLAIRTAILVRSKQYETSIDPQTNTPFAVTPTNRTPCWAECDIPHTFVMTNIDGTPDTFADNTPDPNNWRYYRYRVYERIVPLRNMYWGTAP